MKRITILLATALMFWGCAQKSNWKEANFINNGPNIQWNYKGEIVGTITWLDSNDCNETAFKLYAREEKNVDGLIDIIMEESCSTIKSGEYEMKSCHCKYSGIGLKYHQIDAKEASAEESSSGSAN